MARCAALYPAVISVCNKESPLQAKRHRKMPDTDSQPVLWTVLDFGEIEKIKPCFFACILHVPDGIAIGHEPV